MAILKFYIKICLSLGYLYLLHAFLWFSYVHDNMPTSLQAVNNFTDLICNNGERTRGNKIHRDFLLSISPKN